jgi:hypothetical protein
MQISSSTPSIQMLKAQQAWEARQAAKTSAPVEQQTPAPVQIETNRPELTASSPATPQWKQTVQEIQNIAQRSGYVGITEQDIRKAYTYGDSLLADYRV